MLKASRIFFLIHILLLLGCQLKAERLLTNTAEEGKNIAPLFSYFRTSNNGLSIVEVMALSDTNFTPLNSDNFSRTFPSGNYWLKIPIDNPNLKSLNFVLASPYGVADTAQYFLVENRKILSTHLAGKNVSTFSKKKYPYPYFRFTIQSGFDGHIYIKSNSCMHLYLPLILWNYDHFIADYSNRSFGVGVAFGTLLLFAFAILIFYFIIRERFFIYYLAYIFSILLFEAEYFGLFHIFTPREISFVKHSQFLILCVSFFALFIKSFFNTRKEHPYFDKLIIVLFITQTTAFCLRLVYHYLPDWTTKLIPFLDYFNISIVAIFAVGLVYINLKKYIVQKKVRYLWLLFSLGTFFISFFFYILMISGSLPSLVVSAILPVTIFIEMILMLGVIAYEYIEIQQEKNKAEVDLLESRQKSMSNLLSGQELERTRLAKELHDSVGSMLAAITFKLVSMRKEGDPVVQELSQLIKSTSSEVRQISHNLMPIALMMGDLNEALEGLCKQFDEKQGLNIIYYGFDLDQALPKQIKVEAYRIVQQLLKNATSHAKASEILVQSAIDSNSLMITVEDNGIGFNPDQVKKGIGLNSIASRLLVLNGTMAVFSQETGDGSSFQIEIPLE